MRERASRYGAAQRRVIVAALDLFSAHGVGGTSLQMIADRIGVTKAAVYHQFNTKEEIVLAVAEVELQRLEEALEAAEAEGSTAEARETLLSRVIDIAIERRHAVTTLQNDPVIVGFLGQHEAFQQLIVRLFTVLMGDDPGPRSRVTTAVVTAAIGGAVAHPFIADIDEDTLRAELLHVTRRLIQLPD
jgi:AcrR family transcriptional regulator